MEKFEIKSQSLTTQYEYENDELVVNGSYNTDKAESTVQSMQGTVYRQAEGDGSGEHVGNFTGTLTDGEMVYAMSKMTRRNSNLVWDAIDGIEAHIKGEGGEA